MDHISKYIQIDATLYPHVNDDRKQCGRNVRPSRHACLRGESVASRTKRNDVDSASPDFCRNLLMEMKAGKIGRHFAWFYASD